MRGAKALLALVLVLGAAGAAGGEMLPRLPPVDEAPQDASFEAFRDRLLEAVRDRDASFLRRAMAEGMRLTFGPDGRSAGGPQAVDLDDPDSRFWTELEEILRLGGSFFRDGRMFCAPYVYSEFPTMDINPYGHWVVLGEDVAVREKPSADSAVVARLSHRIVRDILEPVTSDDRGTHWVKVGLGDGREGFIPERRLRSPIGYRACFQKTGPTWTMVAFTAGD